MSDPEQASRTGAQRDREAQAAVRAYNRGSWLRFVTVLVPVPLIVVTFRLHLVDWHYYILGGAFLIVAMAMYLLDERAAARRDAVLKAVNDDRPAPSE